MLSIVHPLLLYLAVRQVSKPLRARGSYDRGSRTSARGFRTSVGAVVLRESGVIATVGPRITTHIRFRCKLRACHSCGCSSFLSYSGFGSRSPQFAACLFFHVLPILVDRFLCRPFFQTDADTRFNVVLPNPMCARGSAIWGFRTSARGYDGRRSTTSAHTRS